MSSSTPRPDASAIRTTLPRIRQRILGLGLAAVTALALSACGGTETAGFAEDPTTAASVESTDGGTSGNDGDLENFGTVERVPVDSGFTYEELGKEITVSETIRPERNTVVTPAGVLTVQQVQAVDEVEPGKVGLPSELDDGREVLSYAPADGEVFRVIEVAFESTGPRNGPTAELSISIDGSQRHIATLGDESVVRLLVSLPEDGGTRLVVASDGHDQFVDVLTGEREEDDVAAAYYRDKAVQEPHHVIKAPALTFPTKTHSGPYEDLVTDFAFTIKSARLTAWNSADGWAAPGEAWLEVSWSHDLRAASESRLGNRFSPIIAGLRVDVDGDVQTADHLFEREWGTTGAKDEHTDWVSVPIDVESVAVSFGGKFTLEIPSGQGAELTTDGSAEYSTDPYEVSFPK